MQRVAKHARITTRARHRHRLEQTCFGACMLAPVLIHLADVGQDARNANRILLTATPDQRLGERVQCLLVVAELVVRRAGVVPGTPHANGVSELHSQ